MDTTRATAERIKSAITEAGITRTDMASLTGIPATTLWRKINGHTPFNVAEIVAISEVLDVKPSSLIAFADAEVAR